MDSPDNWREVQLRLQRQQGVYRVFLFMLAALLAFLALFYLLTWWQTGPAPAELVKDDFRLAVWRIPDDQVVFRIIRSAEPGWLLFCGRGSMQGNLRKLTITPHALKSDKLEAGPSYSMLIPIGAWPELGWPDGRCIVHPPRQPVQAGTERTETWTLFHYGNAASGGQPQHHFQLRGHGYFDRAVTYIDGHLLARAFTDDQDSSQQELLVCARDAVSLPPMDLTDVRASGLAWADGEFQQAIKDGKRTILVYRPRQRCFVQDEALTKLGQIAHSSGYRGNLVACQNFAVFEGDQGWLMLHADGTGSQIHKISPIVQRPDGSKRSNLEVMLCTIRYMRTSKDPASSKKYYEEQQAAIRQQWRRVPPDISADMSGLVAVDQHTAAIVDGVHYGRVVLISLATPPP